MHYTTESKAREEEEEEEEEEGNKKRKREKQSSSGVSLGAATPSAFFPASICMLHKSQHATPAVQLPSIAVAAAQANHEFPHHPLSCEESSAIDATGPGIASPHVLCFAQRQIQFKQSGPCEALNRRMSQIRASTLSALRLDWLDPKWSKRSPPQGCYSAQNWQTTRYLAQSIC